MVAPARLCRPCWDDWWNAPEADDPKWEALIKTWNEEQENAIKD